MARLPTRKELADRIEKLERDLMVATAGAGVGATLARSPAARAAALSGAARVSPYALAVDALIREEESVLGRVAQQAIPAALDPIQASIADLTTITSPQQFQKKARATPKRKSAFNKMVSAGMKSVKASTSYGKKGTINNAKKAFSAVTKAASAVTKGKKAPRKGIKGRLMRLMKRSK